MVGMFLAAALFVAVFVFLLFWLSGLLERCGATCKIKFSDFQQWYAIAPRSWRVPDVGCNYVGKYLDESQNMWNCVDCYFGFIDYLRFSAWNHKRLKQSAKRSRYRETEQLLKSVQGDIDTVMAKVQKDREDVTATMKRVAENPNPPSPVEDFLKIWRGIKIH